MNKRNANPELMAHWMLAWKTLGRWQELNARLSRDAAPLTSGWARRSTPAPAARVLVTARSAP